jgi:hypothetical protein
MLPGAHHQGFWMSDKPKVQAELADILAGLAMDLQDDGPLLYISAFWRTMINEWNGIDRLRLDKFYLLLRRFHSKTFDYLASKDWDDDLMDTYHEILTEGPLHPTERRVPDGLRYHTTEAYLEELANSANENKPRLTAEQQIRLFAPLYHVLQRNGDIWQDKALGAIDEFLTLLHDTPTEEAEKGAAMRRMGLDSKALISRLEQLDLGKNQKKLEKLLVKHQKLIQVQPPSPVSPIVLPAVSSIVSLSSSKKRKSDGQASVESDSPSKKRKMLENVLETETPKVVKLVKTIQTESNGPSPASKSVSWSMEQNKIKVRIKSVMLTIQRCSRSTCQSIHLQMEPRRDQAMDQLLRNLR